MSKYTADEVERVAKAARKDGWGNWPDMLEELASRLRQEEDENRRDPVMDPRPGDRIELKDGDSWIYCPGSGPDASCGKNTWVVMCESEGATIILRREVQQ